jgi:uncharacterized protein (TIGR02594 family)
MTVPYWMAIARKYVGTAEVPGPTSHPTILQWAKNMGGWVTAFFRDDATPWCALALNGVLQEAKLPLSGPPGSPALLRAKSFETYGTPLDVPCLGAILVFTRPGGGGHVGLYEGETLKAYRVLGGNTGDRMDSAWIAKTRLTAIRWPDPTVTPGDHVWLRPDSTPLSVNEQ